jgi:hypothetical protein
MGSGGSHCDNFNLDSDTREPAATKFSDTLLHINSF